MIRVDQLISELSLLRLDLYKGALAIRVGIILKALSLRVSSLYGSP